MTNLSAKQHEYLRAMGIDVWLPREVSPAESFKQEAAQAVTAVAAEPSVVVDNIASPAVVVTETAAPPETVAPVADVSDLDWDSLQTRVAECRLCELHKSRTQTVFGVGNRNADWLIIGEAPGADEDRQGEPFVGRAGQLLNAMLQALGLSRQDVYIANILKCRPPQNRDPKPDEVAHCTPYLQAQIQLIQPKVILALGRIAAQNLLQTNTALGRLRGKVHHIDISTAPVIVTYHPAYLLRSPLEKRKSWEDLLFAKNTLAAADS